MPPRLIAHRANMRGPDAAMENSPDAIWNAISCNCDVEIDVRIIEGRIFLGHDEPTYEISASFLHAIQDRAWIHCKNLDALDYFSRQGHTFNFFWHQNDDYTVTSKGFIWAYPGQRTTDRSIVVMPEWNDFAGMDNIDQKKCYGICTDYITRFL